MRKIGVLLSRPDFRRNPALALWRRLAWRTRWRMNARPWVLGLPGGRRIAAPHGGSGALIYYQGESEPETAHFLRSFLRPGMTFLDIGAHIGEYTILGSDAVGPAGTVHAFEPSPDVFHLLQSNVRMNRLENVQLHRMAVAESIGTKIFEVCREPSISSLDAPAEQASSPPRDVISRIPVPATTLDEWWTSFPTHVDLIKVDVEGAELSVLRGGQRLLSLEDPQAPVIVLEYSQQNYGRFGYGGRDLVTALRSLGYDLFECSGHPPLVVFEADRVGPTETVNVVAARRTARLAEVLRERSSR